MDKVVRIESELELNRVNILKIQGVDSLQKEYRDLLLQRSNLKDMLIEAYRDKLLKEYGVTCIK